MANELGVGDDPPPADGGGGMGNFGAPELKRLLGDAVLWPPDGECPRWEGKSVPVLQYTAGSGVSGAGGQVGADH